MGISYNGPRVWGSVLYVATGLVGSLVCLQFNNTKPKVSFTVKSASYHACRFVLTSLNSHLSNKNTPCLVLRIPHCHQTRYYSTRHVRLVPRLLFTEREKCGLETRLPGMYAGSDHNVLNWKMGSYSPGNMKTHTLCCKSCRERSS